MEKLIESFRKKINSTNMTIKEWTAANAGKKNKKKSSITKLCGILKGKIRYSENAFSKSSATV